MGKMIKQQNQMRKNKSTAKKSKKVIYGVRLDGKISAKKVRNAIIRCFILAHKEAVKEGQKGLTEKQRRRLITGIVKNAFETSGGDFNHPAKKDIPKVLGKLKCIAKSFRSPNIINMHYRQIMELAKG